MTAHLLRFDVGPVQEMIAAARRTRDLWLGSFLLSEVSKAVAKTIMDHGGLLIFPSPAKPEDLNPDSTLNVANVILAELPEGRDPKFIVASARESAQMRWREFAEQAREDCQRIIRDQIWNEQVDDILELYAAWVPFTPVNYSQQRQRLARLLSGRKSCRNFLVGDGHPGVPKSSLDGLRETVLRDEDRNNWPTHLRHRLRLRTGEQLDVLGIVKRTGGDKKRYPSVSRIAADPWLRGVVAQGLDLQPLRQACEHLVGSETLHRVDTSNLHEDYNHFPYEGTTVYRNRHRELADETGENIAVLDFLRSDLEQVERAAGRARLGAEPDPYVAVLVADGDKMGQAISSLNTPAGHRTFSGNLANFANEAGRIVKEHHGVLIYSGGDDVLALLPVDQMLKCAEKLHEAFEQSMKKALPDLNGGWPTLSVGLAVGHFMENLEDLLEYGRAAEKAAKRPDRDGLAVHLHKRGGGPIRVRKPWTEGLHSRLSEAAGWFLSSAISNRTPYELHRLADVYHQWPEQTLKNAICCDAVRVIRRKRPEGDETAIETARTQIESRINDRINNAKDLREFAKELLIARQIAVAMRQSGSQTQGQTT
jgi:CRISPR-associated protein Cmr2